MYDPQQRLWYAVRVKSNCERMAATALHSKGYEEFFPTYRSRRQWSDRIKEIEAPLFPGYVFARFDARNRLPILTTPGVVKIVGFGNQSVPVADEEIQNIVRVLDSQLIFGPWPFLQAGQRVRVSQGSLTGLEGIFIQAKRAYRLVISVSMLQRSLNVEIDRSWVTPLAIPPISLHREQHHTDAKLCS